MAKEYPTPPAYAEFRQVEGGYLVLTAKGVNESFGQDLTMAEKDLVFAVQGATQSAILGTPITKAAWHDKPSWFVIASNDRTIAPEQEISTAKRMGAKTLTLASSHLAMLAKPNEVAAFIVEAATSLGANTKTVAAKQGA
jgi:pimeloyl-ACP methyl ester carboxylesterase